MTVRDCGAALEAALVDAAVVPEGGAPDLLVDARVREAAAASDDDVLRAIAAALASGPDPASRDAASAAAVAVAAASDDPVALARALLARRLCLAGPAARAGTAVEIDAELAALAEETGSMPLTLAAACWRAAERLESGDRAGAERALGEASMAAVALRDARHVWRVAALQGLRAQLGGRLADAERHVEAARAAGAPGRLVPALAALRILGGRVAELEGVLDAGPASLRAAALAELGRTKAARTLLAACDPATVPRDGAWALHVVGVALAAAALRDGARADAAHATLAPCAGRLLVVGPAQACLGPASRWLALLAATAGRTDAAEQHFLDALGLADRLGLAMDSAHAERDWALLRLARSGPGDLEAAREQLARAAETFRQHGCDALAERTLAALGDDIVVVPPPAARGVFRRDGSRWLVGWDGQVVELPDGPALRWVATLLAQPGRTLHVRELVGLAPAAADPAAERLALYWRLADPDRAADAGDLAAEFVAAHAPRATGPDRDLARLRAAVVRRLRTELGRIVALHPALGRHLVADLRVGVRCCYRPGEPVSWEL